MHVEGSGERRLVLPKSLISAILSELHSAVAAAHHSFDMMFRRVLASYLLMLMTRDVRLAVLLCTPCDRFRKPVPAPHAPFHPVESGGPFEIVAMDIVGERIP